VGGAADGENLMLPKLISFGDLFLPSYGLMIALGFLAGLWLTARLARRSGLDPDLCVNLGIYCAIAAILGAKLFMFLQDWEFYLRNPGEILSLATLRAGGIFYGGLILALGTGVYYMRRHKLPVLRTMDIFAPGIALGHAIGRVGCFLAGCCWGSECHLPWAVTFTNTEAHEMFGTPLGVPLHPAQLYEVGAVGIIAWVLYRRFHQPHRLGSIMGLYLTLYCGVRFMIEFFRAHEKANPFGGPISMQQWVAAGLFLLGVWMVARKQAVGPK
jgi:phosphatidylglycerol:prolipoprotein diacylglycerol transferase